VCNLVNHIIGLICKKPDAGIHALHHLQAHPCQDRIELLTQTVSGSALP
jgi:hypothetical protein